MPIISGGTIAEGALGSPYQVAGSPSAGTDQVFTITFGGSPSAGNFTLTFDGHTTAAITWSATNNTLRDNVDAALEALANVGTGGFTTAVGTMTAGVGTLTVTAAGNLTKQSLGSMAATVGTLNGTVAAATTTPGVNATGRGAPVGALLQDTTNGLLYSNTGTALAPTWTKVGTQT